MHEQTGQTYQPARRPCEPARRPAGKQIKAAAAASTRVFTEALESRTLMAAHTAASLAVGPNVNVTKLLENQNTAAIAINPTNPANLFVATINDARNTGPLDGPNTPPDTTDPTALVPTVLGAYSLDAGVTWEFTGEGIAIGGQNPSVAFDEFGNLFLASIAQTIQDIDNDGIPDVFVTGVGLSISTDGGQTFTAIANFPATSNAISFFDPTLSALSTVQPTVTTGAGSVWVTFETGGGVAAAGARVFGFGSVDAFTPVQQAPRSEGGQFGDIAVGPNGEVMVTYQVARRGDINANGAVTGPIFFFGDEIEDPNRGPAEIFVNVDPDGPGPETFGRRYKATNTNVGIFDPIPAQIDRKIDAEVGIVFDRSGGPFNGRAWMVYTDEGRDESSSDTNIFVRFSDDQGKTWSTPRQVNDQDFNERSQFLPRIALDQTTGNIAVTWYDTRGTENNASSMPNDETRYWGTVGVPTIAEAGVSFATNVQISSGISNGHRSRALTEIGDYSGLDFRNNVFSPVWADNSNSTGDNPSGGVISGLDLSTLDIYTARVIVTPSSPPPPSEAPIGPGSPLTPDFVSKGTVTKGKSFVFRVSYTSSSGIDLASLGDDDLLVTGPNGYNLFADFLKAKKGKRGTVVTATYQAFAPGGKWDSGDNGLYSLLLQADSVRDLAGVGTDAGLLDQFLVSSTAAPQSPANQPASAALQPAVTALDGADDDKLAAVGL